MLIRVPHLRRLGRFSAWDAPAALRALTLIHGRNGAGKSTLARLLRAAAQQDAPELQLDRTLGTTLSPELTLALSEGESTYTEGGWSGPVPKISVFDRRFIEQNVYIGRRSSKEHRRELLRLALGASDAAAARELDELSKRGRKLSSERTPHQAILDAAARSFRLTTQAFLAQPEVPDVAVARAQAEKALDRARLRDEIIKRQRPGTLPGLPALEIDTIATLLARTTKTIGAQAAATVKAHLEKTLHGKGEAWVRAGLAHAGSGTCPFCAQSLEGVELMDLYRQWFDRGYEQTQLELETQLASLGRLDEWWREVKFAGQANARAISTWGDLGGAERPSFDSAQRKADLDALVATLRKLLEDKRANPTKAVSAVALGGVRERIELLANAVHVYNRAVTSVNAWIDAQLAELAKLSVEDAQRAVAQIDGLGQRSSPEVQGAIAELARIDLEIAACDAAKVVAMDRVKQRSGELLAGFAGRINELLAALGADFQIEELATERSGGTTGARFTLRVAAGTLEVASSPTEERFARVLSDGDRSILAFALFLLSLDAHEDLAERIVVFDDPMTSQDAQRSEATAAHIAAVAARAAQVIVLSHQPAFLALVARDRTDVAHLALEGGLRASLDR